MGAKVSKQVCQKNWIELINLSEWGRSITSADLDWRQIKGANVEYRERRFFEFNNYYFHFKDELCRHSPPHRLQGNIHQIGIRISGHRDWQWKWEGLRASVVPWKIGVSKSHRALFTRRLPNISEAEISFRATGRFEENPYLSAWKPLKASGSINLILQEVISLSKLKPARNVNI